VHQAFDVRIFYKQCRSLAQLGYQVHLIASHDHDQTVDNVNIKAIAKPTSRLSRMLFSGFSAFKQALKLKADLYHIHDPELIPYGFVLSILGKRVVFDMHENISKSILTKPWIPECLQKFISSFVYSVERVLLRRLGVVFAESSYHKDFSFLSNTTTILNYPRLEDLKNLHEEKYENFTLSYLGSISKDRGLITTLEALALLEQRGYQCDFDCIGRVPEALNPLILSIQNRLKKQKVRFHGFLPSKDSYQVLAKTHVGLSILSPAPNYIESIPTKMFEYMALGLPVILSNFPLLQELINTHGGGYCIPPSDPEQLAQIITKLIDEPETYTKLSEQGRSTVSTHFSWQSQLGKLDNFYKKILAT